MQHRFRATLIVATMAVGLVCGTAGAATKTTTAGPPLAKPPAGVPPYADVPQFFPTTTAVHAGDTVKWKFFGFHSVYFPKQGGKNVVLLTADATRKYAELDPAGAPFFFNGGPQLVANPPAAFPLGGKTEDGKAATGSGVPQSDSFVYKLKFPKAGSFTYYCTIHANMKATVKVLPKVKKVRSVAADKKAIDKQVATAIAAVKKDDKRAPAAGDVVEAGRDTNATSLLAFFPAKKTVPVGTKVDFRMSPKTNEIHTVTFGSDAILAKGGFVDTVEKAVIAPLPGTGQNGPPVLGMPGSVFYPSDQGPLSFDGTQHGGFLNAGLMGAKPLPLPTHDEVTFTKAGTYNYVCMIHPEMKGQIIVQ